MKCGDNKYPLFMPLSLEEVNQIKRKEPLEFFLRMGWKALLLSSESMLREMKSVEGDLGSYFISHSLIAKM